MGLIVANQQSFDPTPRPALRKATDSAVHPVAPKPIDRSHQDLGLMNNTSDSVRPKKNDKLIAMTITIPKSLRKQLKKDAKSRGVSIDEIISERLAQ
jgi:hypothetical protein